MATVRNSTTGALLAGDAEWVTSLWARFRGLMMRRDMPPGGGIVIRPCGSIHMLFMRFDIDAVFFDSEGRVTKVARSVRPWVGVALGGRGAKGVVELPRGIAVGTERGHVLSFEG